MVQEHAMWRQYAVDPAALNCWGRVREITNAVGWEHGRLIAEFPSCWRRLVYAACRGAPDVDKKRIEERLCRLKPHLVNLGLEYDIQRSWMDNARKCQKGVIPHFDALVLSEEAPDCGPFVLFDDLDANEGLWSVPHDTVVPRTPATMAHCAYLLLQHSREVIFVDAYFDPSQARFRNVLGNMLGGLSGSREYRRLEMHATNKKSGTTDHWTDECRRWLARFIPEGKTLRLCRWKEHDENGDAFHARYVLTDLGGLRYDVGLDEDARSGEGVTHETTDVTRLSQQLRDERWGLFLPIYQDIQNGRVPCGYEFVDKVDVKGTRPVRHVRR